MQVERECLCRVSLGSALGKLSVRIGQRLFDWSHYYVDAWVLLVSTFPPQRFVISDVLKSIEKACPPPTRSERF